MAKAVIPTANNFQKGFNYGYLLAKHSPDLLNKLLPTLEPSNEFLKAIHSGKEQFNKEQVKRKTDIAPKKESREHDLDKDR